MTAPHLRLIRGGVWAGLDAPKRSFLIVHRKGIPDEQLEVIQRLAASALLPWSGGQSFTLTTAKKDWQENFDRCGGWDGWVRATVERDFASSDWRYTGYIAAGYFHGSASARILHLALERGAPVVALDEQGRLHRVVSVVHIGNSEYQTITTG